MHRPTTLLLLTVFVCSFSHRCVADEPVTLMGKLSPWMYPKASMGGAQMSDAATIDGSGNRTVPSIACKTTMKTNDSVEKVIAFYKEKLGPAKDADSKEQAERKEGRSVLISDESDGRPFALHTILVNTASTSTTLIISRGASEKQTHIIWKHYARL
ncbi:MAG: hypothetical protein AAGG48_11455 [Planctomycetota bacterium]